MARKIAGRRHRGGVIEKDRDREYPHTQFKDAHMVGPREKERTNTGGIFKPIRRGRKKGGDMANTTQEQEG